MSTCKIIAIANQKGGTGKTTTTVNLGIGLARQGNVICSMQLRIIPPSCCFVRLTSIEYIASCLSLA